MALGFDSPRPRPSGTMDCTIAPICVPNRACVAPSTSANPGGGVPVSVDTEAGVSSADFRAGGR